MKRLEESIVPVGLGVAGLLFLVSALKPSFSGNAINVTFLLIGLVCGVLAAVAWRKSRRASGA